MNLISNIGTNASSYKALNPTGKTFNTASIVENRKTNSLSYENQENYNFRDISIGEINSLIKGGQTSLLEVVPFISPSKLAEVNYSPDEINKIQVNLLQQVESTIEYGKSIGEDTSHFESVLSNLYNINRNETNNSIDINI